MASDVDYSPVVSSLYYSADSPCGFEKYTISYASPIKINSK